MTLIKKMTSPKKSPPPNIIATLGLNNSIINWLEGMSGGIT